MTCRLTAGSFSSTTDSDLQNVEIDAHPKGVAPCIKHLLSSAQLVPTCNLEQRNPAHGVPFNRLLRSF
jgi:hypothetical protein